MVPYTKYLHKQSSVWRLPKYWTPTPRVATKISRNEIPRYFVLFLFRIFLKIWGKFPRNFFSQKCSYFVIFRGIPYIWLKLSERKLVWGHESRWSLWRPPPPPGADPPLTKVMLGGVGEGGVCGLAWNHFYPASIFSLVMAWHSGWQQCTVYWFCCPILELSLSLVHSPFTHRFFLFILFSEHNYKRTKHCIRQHQYVEPKDTTSQKKLVLGVFLDCWKVPV